MSSVIPNADHRIAFDYKLDEGGFPPTIEDIQLAWVEHVLRKSNGNKTQAAKHLGIDRRSLYRLLAKIKAKTEAAAKTETESWTGAGTNNLVVDTTPRNPHDTIDDIREHA